MRTREDHRGWVRTLPSLGHDSPGTKGSLQVRAYKGRPFYEARWRDLNRTQRRKLGDIEPAPDVCALGCCPSGRPAAGWPW